MNKQNPKTYQQHKQNQTQTPQSNKKLWDQSHEFATSCSICLLPTVLSSTYKPLRQAQEAQIADYSLTPVDFNQ